jgi:excisionase family DNA binding protein
MKDNTGQKLPGPATSPRLLISIDEACRLLSVSRATFHRLMDAGEIRSVKIGFSRRVLWEDIERIAREGSDHKAPRVGLDALRQQERAAKAKAGTVTPARRRRHQQTQPAALR